MTSAGHSRYMKALAISLGPAADVLHLYFENKVIEGKELCDFLNDVNIKHILFHENIPTVPCCECLKVSIAAPKKRGNLGNTQFSLLYSDNRTSQPNHIIQHKGNIKQHCLCRYLAGTSLAVEDLDITIMCIIIDKCCPPKKHSSVSDLKVIRDRLVHLGDRQLNESQFEQFKNELQGATRRLANLIGKSYAKTIKDQIENLCTEDHIDELRKIVLKSKEDIKELRIGMNGVLEGGQFTSELQDITNTQRKQGEDIEQMKATLECLLYAQFGEVQTLTDVNRLPKCSNTVCEEACNLNNNTDGDERTHDVLVKIKTPADWDKGKIAEKMKERVEKDHKMNSSRDIQLIDFKFKCLLLKTKVSSYLLQNRSELMCAIGRFLKSILDDCEIDFSKPETIMITIDVQSSEALWRDEDADMTDMIVETQNAKQDTVKDTDSDMEPQTHNAGQGTVKENSSCSICNGGVICNVCRENIAAEITNNDQAKYVLSTRKNSVQGLGKIETDQILVDNSKYTMPSMVYPVSASKYIRKGFKVGPWPYSSDSEVTVTNDDKEDSVSCKTLDSGYSVSCEDEINPGVKIGKTDSGFLDCAENTTDPVKKRFLKMLRKAWEHSCSNGGTGGSLADASMFERMSIEEIWTEVFDNLILSGLAQVINFTQLFPGFTSFSESDQISLLKNGCFQALLVLLSDFLKDNAFSNQVFLSKLQQKLGRTEQFFFARCIKTALILQQFMQLNCCVEIVLAFILTNGDSMSLQNGKTIQSLKTQILGYIIENITEDQYVEFLSLVGDLNTLRVDFMPLFHNFVRRHPSIKFHPLIKEMFSVNAIHC